MTLLDMNKQTFLSVTISKQNKDSKNRKRNIWIWRLIFNWKKTFSSFCADHQTVFKLTWSWTVRASPDWGLTFKFFAHVGFFPVNLSLESEQRPSWRHLSEDAGIRDCNQLLRLCAMLCATTCQSSTYQVFSGDHIKTVSSNFCQPLPFFAFSQILLQWPFAADLHSRTLFCS